MTEFIRDGNGKLSASRLALLLAMLTNCYGVIAYSFGMPMDAAILGTLNALVAVAYGNTRYQERREYASFTQPEAMGMGRWGGGRDRPDLYHTELAGRQPQAGPCTGPTDAMRGTRWQYPSRAGTAPEYGE